MHASFSAPVPDLTLIQEPAEVQATPAAPAGTGPDRVAIDVRIAQDRDRIADRVNDVLVHRIFSAGLALHAALALLDDHCAVGRIQEAVGELDLAVRDLRDIVFAHHRPD